MSTDSFSVSWRILLFCRAYFPRWKDIIHKHNRPFFQSVLVAVPIIHLTSSHKLEFPMFPLSVWSEPEQIDRQCIDLNEIWQFHKGLFSSVFNVPCENLKSKSTFLQILWMLQYYITMLSFDIITPRPHTGIMFPLGELQLSWEKLPAYRHPHSFSRNNTGSFRTQITHLWTCRGHFVRFFSWENECLYISQPLEYFWGLRWVELHRWTPHAFWRPGSPGLGRA